MTLQADGWWFCSEPGMEEIRFHTDSRTGSLTGATLRCRHGRWSGDSDAILTEARVFHGYTHNPPATPAIGA